MTAAISAGFSLMWEVNQRPGTSAASAAPLSNMPGDVE